MRHWIQLPFDSRPIETRVLQEENRGWDVRIGKLPFTKPKLRA